MSPRQKWLVENCSGKVILDVGFAKAGSKVDPIFSKLKSSFTDKLFIGIDIASAKVRELKLPNSIIGDGKALPIKNGSVDTVILGEILEHNLDYISFLSEAYRVLKSGDTLLITTPNPYGFFRWVKYFLLSKDLWSNKHVREFLGDKEHEMFYEPLSLANVLYKIGFSRVEYTSTNPSIPYLPDFLREKQINRWPFTRLGTISCFVANK